MTVPHRNHADAVVRRRPNHQNDPRIEPAICLEARLGIGEPVVFLRQYRSLKHPCGIGKIELPLRQRPRAFRRIETDLHIHLFM